MKNVLYVLKIFVLISSSCSVNKNLNNNIAKYYYHVNKAEIHIVDSNYNLSLKSYKEAEDHKELSSDDLYNACVVSFLVKDKESYKKYISIYGKYGLPRSKFEEFFWVKNVIMDTFYKMHVDFYDSVYILNKPHDTFFYGNIMNNLLILDQSVRSAPIIDSNGIPISPGIENPNRENIDKKIRLMFKQYCRKYGFPTLNRTGFIDKEKHEFSSGSFWYIWWHSNGKDLNKFLKPYVINGEFSPEEYILGMERNLNSKDKIYFAILDDKNRVRKNINNINKKRNSMYLESIEDYERKII